MPTFKTIILWTHLSVVALWVGGQFAMWLVLFPVLKRALDSPKEVARVTVLAAQRFQRVSRELVTIILITGIFNVINAGVARRFEFNAVYMRLLMAKVLLFVAIAGIQAWQSYKLAPRLAELPPDTSGEGSAKEIHKRLLMTSLLILVLAFAAILLGLSLGYR